MNEFRLDRFGTMLSDHWLAVTLVVVAWVALMTYTVLRGGARWRPTRPLAVLAGIASAVSALFTVPVLAGLPFGAFADPERWLALAAVSLAAGLIAFAFAWPAAATTFRSRN